MSLHARGRHRRRSTTAVTLVNTGTAAALITGTVFGLAGTASAAGNDDFARLRNCESSGNYATNTGNGYYGAYQFDLQTWHSLGYSGRPSDASAATQDQAASELQAQRGWQPWPACSRKLGLSGGGGGSATVVAVSHDQSVSASDAQVGSAPAFPGTMLTTHYVDSYRDDVRAWQARMAERGVDIAVDGYFGPQTRDVATSFQRANGLTVDGIVGPQTWAASWSA